MVILLGLLIPGCVARPAGVFLSAPAPQPQDQPSAVPNLLLGPSPQHVRMGLNWAGRSSWPSVAAGYRLDDVTYYSDFQDDEQFYFGRFGGYYRTAVTARSAVVLR